MFEGFIYTTALPLNILLNVFIVLRCVPSSAFLRSRSGPSGGNTTVVHVAEPALEFWDVWACSIEFCLVGSLRHDNINNAAAGALGRRAYYVYRYYSLLLYCTVVVQTGSNDSIYVYCTYSEWDGERAPTVKQSVSKVSRPSKIRHHTADASTVFRTAKAANVFLHVLVLYLLEPPPPLPLPPRAATTALKPNPVFMIAANATTSPLPRSPSPLHIVHFPRSFLQAHEVHTPYILYFFNVKHASNKRPPRPYPLPPSSAPCMCPPPGLVFAFV